MIMRKKKKRSAADVLTGVAGAVLGSAAMYWMDPRSGRRRRALVVDRAVHVARKTERAVGKGKRDLWNRSRGAAAEAAGLAREEPVSDDVLAERVRSELGRVCSHPGALEVTARNGVIRLEGEILRREHRRAIRAVAHVRGVEEVHDQLKVHRDPAGVPALQGGSRRVPRFEYLQRNWAPAPRWAAGAMGAGLAAWGLLRRGGLGLGGAVAGTALLARSVANTPLRRLVGLGRFRPIVLQQDLTVHAPPEEVYAFWRAFENFPRFMTHVKSVRELTPTRYHWTVEGPGGLAFAWDADVTHDDPGRLIAWQSSRDTLVPNSGVVRFDPADSGETRIEIRMEYQPPGGVMGHAFASLLGADPRRQMQEDLARFKSLLEAGRTSADQGTVTREEVAPEEERGSWVREREGRPEERR